MASLVCETLAYDGVKGMEIKGDLLMSLMEELPCDESDDERLDSLIRSFEDEISGSKIGNHDSQLKSGFEKSSESWNIGQVEEGDDYGVEYWVDMDLMPSFQFDDGNWGAIESCGDEKDVMVDHLMMCDDGFDIEENSYNSFWQDNYEMGLVH
ncbi:uncharacterized protein [Cicer arietinum]|uniref:Uncharacterized protein LOC101496473 n=1 Tax=Cicer arietinum TaxID=3827 RepID=A0A1S2XIF4_CICAR|nr:uncharacterized protein LOC101496473 [Cicer arietinum]